MFDDPAGNDCAIDAVEPVMQAGLGDGRVADLARAHLAQGGGRVRARLALDIGEMVMLPREIAIGLAAGVELLHNASLIHDDLQDGDIERRGAPALWRVHGVALSICAGDLMISAAFDRLGAAGGGKAVALAHAAVAATAEGQARDLAAAPGTGFDDFVAIAEAKCGPLLALPGRLGLAVAGLPGDAAAVRAGYALARGYQIADDIADRARDARAGRLNACLALEAAGHDPNAARRLAVAEARTALAEAQRHAARLPQGAGDPLAALAGRVAAKLDEAAHAA